MARTGDRMRSAMMELTGLDKVGGYTLLDNNGVQHITNRHAGGDGSADATMKNSADVARAAYVLNNFDNAYLAKDRAKGYRDSRGKRVPIVMFEKKIDGTHIIVEAVMDTKKSTNYIVSEYLSKNGVDEKEIAKRLQSSMDAVADPRDTSGTLGANHLAVTEAQQAPMDAASDPRHTSETFSAHSSTTAEVLRSPVNAVADPGDNVRNVVADPSAETSIAPGEGSVNGNRVENSVETVKSTTADGMPSQSAQSAASSPEGRANVSAGAVDAENRTERQATGSATKGSGVKYSIQTDDDGKKFVQVDGDFLKDVPEENWKNTARDAIRDLFPDDFERGG